MRFTTSECWANVSFQRTYNNTKISSLVAISGITANTSQFFSLPMQKISRVSTLNFIAGQPFKIMLLSYNSSQLSFKSIYRCTYMHTHSHKCTNNPFPYSFCLLISLFPFPCSLRLQWRADCTGPCVTSSPGISRRSARAFSKALCQFIWISKWLFADRVRNRNTALPVRREVPLVQISRNLTVQSLTYNFQMLSCTISNDKPHSS